MKKVYYISILAIATFLLAMFLPWLINLCGAKKSISSFTLYSSAVNDFTYVQPQEGKTPLYKSRKGRVFTEDEFDSINPYFFYRQLATDNRLPEGITANQIRKSNFNIRVAPSDFNSPSIALYPLFESLSGRVDLKTPEDVFRINSKGIEFVQMRTNGVNKDKSKIFTDALKSVGFEFPANLIAGNPTSLKDYDNGYLLVDKKKDLYHLKMIKGKPFAKHILNDLKVKNIIVAEFPAKKILAFINDADNNVFTLSMDDYSWKGLPFKWDSSDEPLSIMGNMQDWTVTKRADDGVYHYAINNANYGLIDKQFTPNQQNVVEKIKTWIFPFEISMTSWKSGWLGLDFSQFSLLALIINVILSVSYYIIRRDYIMSLFIIPFGLFLYIPALVFKR